MPCLKALLLTIMVIPHCVTFAQPEHEHTVSELRQDFNLFRSALEKSHAGVYWYRPKSEIDHYFEAADAQLNRKMTELEFYRVLAPLISKIGCGHTWIATTEPTQEKIWEQEKVLPLKLKFLAGRAYCLQNNGLDSTLVRPGDEVLHINEYSIDSLLKLSARFSPGDGFIEVGKWRLLDKVFNQFYTLYLDQPARYRLLLKRGEEIKEVVLQPLALKETEAIARRRYGTKERSSDNIAVSFLPDHQAALLTVREFSDWKSQNQRVKFDDELKRSFEKIRSSQAQNLIIDLRDNDGGNEEYGLLLLSYLTRKPFIGYKQVDFRTTRFSYRKHTTTSWLQLSFLKALLRHRKLNDTTYLLRNTKATKLHQPAKHPFIGKVYVLINRGSFSTTSDFAALVHTNELAIFVGEETAGSYLGNTSNYTFEMTLPNTKIRVNIPVARYQTNVTAGGYFGRGVIPHHSVTYSIEDVLNGVDKDLETVLGLMKE